MITLVISLLMLMLGVVTPIAGFSEGCEMNDQVSANWPPLKGTMAGVKLSIPRTEYGVPSVHYGQEKDFWGVNPRKTYGQPEQDSIIRDFFITLNRSAFRPVCSKADLYSFAGNSRLYGDDNLPPESSRWLDFVFSPRMYVENEGRLQRLYAQQIDASKGLIGPFHARPDAFGLRHLSSDREGGPFLRSEAREVFDTWYFDDKNWNTLIACARKSANQTPNKISCIHYFTVPELKAVVYVRYMAMADVSEWSRIEHEVRKVARSFVVTDSETQH